MSRGELQFSSYIIVPDSGYSNLNVLIICWLRKRNHWIDGLSEQTESRISSAKPCSSQLFVGRMLETKVCAQPCLSESTDKMLRLLWDMRIAEIDFSVRLLRACHGMGITLKAGVRNLSDEGLKRCYI